MSEINEKQWADKFNPFLYEDLNRATKRATLKGIFKAARKNSKLAVKKYEDWTVQHSDTSYFLTAEEAIMNLKESMYEQAVQKETEFIKQQEETNE